MAAKKIRAVYCWRVAHDKRRDKWVMRKVLYDPIRHHDSYATKTTAQEVVDLYTRRAVEKKAYERKEASRQRIVQGIQSLTSEDLTNLRDWFVALLQLRR